MDESQLKEWIKQNERLKLHPYLDTTGHVTIGWGRNLDNGISKDEAQLMFENDFNRTLAELKQYSWYLTSPLNVRYTLINMNFNLGIEKLLTFKKMIHALINKNYKEAAKEALNSTWAKQVGERANQIADMMSTEDE